MTLVVAIVAMVCAVTEPWSTTAPEQTANYLYGRHLQKESPDVDADRAGQLRPPRTVVPVLNGSYRDLFPAIADCAAALTGLLFVAMTVARHHAPPDRPVVIEQVRAAVSILAFTNALVVSLYGLVPGNNVGYPATVVAVIGILFTAAGTRSIFSSHLPRRHVPRQLGLIAILLATFVSELAGGIYLIMKPHSNGAAELVSDLLIALLIIGIARAWELVRERDTSLLASIEVLTGHGGNPDGPLPSSASPDLAGTERAAGPRSEALTGADDRPE